MKGTFTNMLHAERIVPEHPEQGKLVATLYMLSTLKWGAFVAIAGALLVILLFVLTLIMDALIELCTHIAQVWNASTSIERLLLFVVAWVFFYKATPALVRVCRRKGL